MEGLLVEHIIAAVWRLRRHRRVEAGIFAWQLYEELLERAQSKAQSYEKRPLDDIVDQDTAITDEQKHREALSKV